MTRCTAARDRGLEEPFDCPEYDSEVDSVDQADGTLLRGLGRESSAGSIRARPGGRLVAQIARSTVLLGETLLDVVPDQVFGIVEGSQQGRFQPAVSVAL